MPNVEIENARVEYIEYKPIIKILIIGPIIGINSKNSTNSSSPSIITSS